MTREYVDGKLHCSKCDEWKLPTEYHKDSRRKIPYQPFCKECAKTYYKAWQDKNPESRQRHHEWKLARKKEAREYVVRYLNNHPCVDCGNDNIRVLVFDHVRGEKRSGVMNLVLRGHKLNTIQEEIDKCEVRCANCHTLVTQERGNHWLFNTAS